MNKNTIVFFIFVSFTLILLIIIMLVGIDKTKKEVDCFDRAGNKIVGQVCEEKVRINHLGSLLMLLNLLLVVIYVIIPGDN